MKPALLCASNSSSPFVSFSYIVYIAGLLLARRKMLDDKPALGTAWPALPPERHASERATFVVLFAVPRRPGARLVVAPHGEQRRCEVDALARVGHGTNTYRTTQGDSVSDFANAFRPPIK